MAAATLFQAPIYYLRKSTRGEGCPLTLPAHTHLGLPELSEEDLLYLASPLNSLRVVLRRQPALQLRSVCRNEETLPISTPAAINTLHYRYLTLTCLRAYRSVLTLYIQELYNDCIIMSRGSQ